MSKIEIFKNWTKIEICRKILLKSKFFEIFENLNRNRNFSKILTKIEIFRNFDRNRKFLKIWPKSKFFETFDLNKIFRNFDQNRPKSKIFENLTKIEILEKIEIFRNFDENRNFDSKFSKKIQIFSKFSVKSDERKFLRKNFFRRFY